MEEKVRIEPFTKIPSEMLEQLARVKLNPNEWKSIMTLLRKTYGYKKDKDKISISQFQLMTGLERKRQSGALKSLVNKRVFNKEPGYIHIYSLNKNYDEWVVAGSPLSMTPEGKDKLVAFRSKLVASAGQLLVAGSPHTIDNTIDKLQIEEDYQEFYPDFSSIPDDPLEQITTKDTTASAIAPAAGPVKSLFINEDIKSDQCSGLSKPGAVIEATASASVFSAKTQVKRLRSIEEIRIEHPGAKRYDFGTTCEAIWIGEYDRQLYEECL